jgi:hypothetical protein
MARRAMDMAQHPTQPTPDRAMAQDLTPLIMPQVMATAQARTRML